MRLSTSSCMRSALFGVYCFDASYPKPKQGQRQAPPSITDCWLAMSMTFAVSVRLRLAGAWHLSNLYKDMRESNCAHQVRDGVCRFEKEYSAFVFGRRIYWRLSHSTRGRQLPRCSRPEALNGSLLYPQWGLLAFFSIAGYITFKFNAWLFKWFIFHYWSDESIDDFFQRRSQSSTLTRTAINNLCKLINSHTQTNTRALMHLYWLHSLLCLLLLLRHPIFTFESADKTTTSTRWRRKRRNR